MARVVSQAGALLFSLSLGLVSVHVDAWGLCNDAHPKCGLWAKNGACHGDAREEYVQKICPHSCGECSLVCRDLDPCDEPGTCHDSCIAWARAGRCENSTTSALMRKRCPTSCGLLVCARARITLMCRTNLDVARCCVMPPPDICPRQRSRRV